MRRRLIYLLVLFCLNTSVSLAQTRRFTKERRVYLWDVTLSMKGYQDKTPDIWDKVVNSIVVNIENIIDQNTEIIVLPYQERILERWTYKATPEGKRELISKIKNYTNNTVTNTNNYVPFKFAINNYLDGGANTRTLIIHLTDGLHNVQNPPVEKFYELINNWCSIALDKNAYAFYVTLTEFAQDKNLRQIIKSTCRIIEIPYAGSINFTELIPQTEVIKYNIKDDKDKELKLRFITNISSTIPDDLEIVVETESDKYISVKQHSVFNNSEISFKLNMNKSIQEMVKELPKNYNHAVTLKLRLTDKSKNKYPLVLLLENTVRLELINKLEKTLKITIK